MGTARRYIAKINKETGFYATWTPSQSTALGDYGSLGPDGEFVRKGNVSDLGFVHVPPLAESRPEDYLELTSGASTKVTIKATGDLLPGSSLPQAKAGVVFSLGSEDSLVVKLTGTTQEAIGNLGDLEKFIVKLYKSGRWTKSWRVVSQRIIAVGTTIVYSDTHGVSVEATAEVPIRNIADVNAQFTVIHTSGGSVHVLGAPNCTPFISLVRLHTPLFGTPGVHTFAPSSVVAGEVNPVLLPASPSDP